MNGCHGRARLAAAWPPRSLATAGGGKPDLRIEDALAILAQFAVRPDVTVEGDGFDAEFISEFGNRGIAALHGGLGKADLSLAEGKLAAAPSPSGAGGLESRQGALADQFTFELRQGRKDAEDEAAGWRCRVDLRALARQHPQADAAVRQFLHDADEMVQVASEAVELPDDERVPLAQCLETGIESGSAVLLARGAVFVNGLLLHACRSEGVILQIEVLGAAGLGDAGVSEVHVFLRALLPMAIPYFGSNEKLRRKMRSQSGCGMESRTVSEKSGFSTWTPQRVRLPGHSCVFRKLPDLLR